MSNLLFVRHAQASLFESDYDQLSEQGRKQARDLGKYLSSQGMVFDEIYSGPRRRHKQTAQLSVDWAAGRSTTAMEIPELDEHQVDRLAFHHLERIGREFPDIQKLEADFRSKIKPHERQRSFARLFEALADLWVASRCDHLDVESWSEFNKRVNHGINEIVLRGGQGRNALIFTSAGTIVVALHRALHCPDEVALGLGWRIWNCSLTSFAFSGNRFSLDQFNAMPHLEDRSDWTYR